MNGDYQHNENNDGGDSSNVKIPPSDQQAEKAVLGAILIDGNAFSSVANILDDSMFYVKKHRTIFKALVLLSKFGNPTDIVSVSDKLEGHKKLDECGGDYYLTELSESVPFPHNIEYWASIVRDKYLLRTLIGRLESAADMAFQPGTSPRELADDLMAEFLKTASSGNYNDITKHISEVAPEAIKNVEKILEGRGKGIKTNIPEVDDVLGMWHPGNTMLLGADTGVGKSAFACDLAMRWARNGVYVCYISLEMKSRELTERFLSSDVNAVDGKDIPYMAINTPGKHRMLDGDEGERGIDYLKRAAARVSKLPIWMVDKYDITVAGIQHECMRVKHKHPDKQWVFIIDYLQLIKPEDMRQSRERQVAEISRGLKIMTDVLDAPVLSLSQFNKAKEFRAGEKVGGKPTNDSFRESGAVVNDASKVFALWAPPDNPREMLLIVTKNRGGKKNVEIPIRSMIEYSRFTSEKELSLEEPPDFGHQYTEPDQESLWYNEDN